MRDRIEVGTELRKALEFAILRQVQAKCTGDLFHRLDLGCTTDAANRNTDVDRRTRTGVEQVRIEEDLAVGNRNDVRRNVGRDVARLRFDNRQRRQRTARLRMTNDFVVRPASLRLGFGLLFATRPRINDAIDAFACRFGRRFVDDNPVLAHLRRTFQQTAMEIEYVARIRLAPRRTTQQQRQLAIRHGLLRQIVVNH